MENKNQPLRRFFRLLQPESKDILYVYLYAIFNGLINLSLPLGIQAIINLITGGQISTSWTVLVVFVMIGIAMTGGLQVFQLTITERLQQRIFTRASFEFAYRIPRLKLESVYKYYVPELVNRFFDTLSVQKGLSKILIDFSTATLQIIFGLILLSFYHPFFIIFGLILILFVYLIFRLTGPQGLKTSLAESKYKYEVAHWLEEVGRNMGTFKLAGDTELPMKKTDELVSNYVDARKNHFKVLIKQYINMVGFKVIIAAGLLIMGSLLVVNQQINLGQFVAAEIVILLTISSVEKLILGMETIYDVLTALEKMGHVTDLPLERYDGLKLQNGNENKGMSLKIRDLTFSYPDGKKKILKNINLDIAPGDRVCISGYNGSGKSTLMQLIAGLYENFDGSLNYNGIPIGNLNLENLRTYIGDSLHEEKLFKGTLYENISLGRPGIDMKVVLQVVEKTFLSEFVQNLKDGFNTIIDPEGKTLPDSIKTKIILARGIACQSKLLLITDHLSRMDSVEGGKIVDFLVDKKNQWTLVLISNQSEIAAKCDKVILMKEGEIINDDKFKNLRNKDTFYQSNIA
ncbi:MAG: ABC transporter ATP-binding protein/permease [Cytophagales bacterium]|nr:ABC transporter ATP-binding protein/permease [Cytophagales bacterium]